MTIVIEIDGELNHVKKNVKLAHLHIDMVRKYLNHLRRTPSLAEPLDSIAFAQADVTAADRILHNVRRRLSSLAGATHSRWAMSNHTSDQPDSLDTTAES